MISFASHAAVIEERPVNEEEIVLLREKGYLLRVELPKQLYSKYSTDVDILDTPLRFGITGLPFAPRGGRRNLGPDQYIRTSL